MFQRKNAGCFLAQLPVALLFHLNGRSATQICFFECKICGLMYLLQWLSFVEGECCSQDGVPLNYMAQALIQSPHVQFSRQTDGTRDVINRQARMHLLQKPYPLLGK